MEKLKLLVLMMVLTGCQTGLKMPVDKGIWWDWRHVHDVEIHFHYHNTVDLGGIQGNKIDQKMDNQGKLTVPLTGG